MPFLFLSTACTTASADRDAGRVVFYTSWPQSTTRQVVDAFNRAHPDVRATYVLGETLELGARIQTESESGSLGGDVVVLADPAVTEVLARDGAFAEVPLPQFAEMRKGYYDPRGRWAAPRIAVGALWYNVEALRSRGLAPPGSWFDLLDPRYAPLTVMPSPVVAGTMATLISATVPDRRFGWGYWRRLAHGGAGFTNYVTDSARMVAARQAGIGYTLSNYTKQYPLHPKGSTRIAVPREGGIIVPSAASVLAEAPHPGAARTFFRYLMSPEVARILVKDGNYSPRLDAPTPQGLLPLARLPAMRLHTDWIMKPESRNEIQRRWHEVTGLSGG
ncbi:extracellular solute-binding protein [Actinomadura sp. KC216]|uniref:extracellular solute-binding protein n=1 Tax=Actinomadura sp. KC216 TaxID=2530370 RepID=UPI0014051EE6|nr:extracellular solute-binding protein [Actinomadura sp. KC216]